MTIDISTLVLIESIVNAIGFLIIVAAAVKYLRS